MDQPLASNDHFASATSFGMEQISDEDEMLEEDLNSCSCASSEIIGVRMFRHDSMARRFGLLTVEEIQSKNLQKVFWLSLALIALYFVIGVAWIMRSNAWSMTDGVYFMVISLVTIGYGDLVVDDFRLDRLIDSLVVLLGLVTLGVWAACATRALGTTRSNLKDRCDIPVPPFDAKSTLTKSGWSLALRLVLFTAVLLIGSVVFMVGERSDFVTGFYWAVVTSSTIGYGDVVPTTIVMKWFTVFYSMVGALTMLETIRFAGAYPFKVWTIKAEAKVFDQFSVQDASERRRGSAMILAETAVTEMLGVPPERQQGNITRSDFALSMLLMLDRISYKDYQQAAQLYDNIDFKLKEEERDDAGRLQSGTSDSPPDTVLPTPM